MKYLQLVLIVVAACGKPHTDKSPVNPIVKRGIDVQPIQIDLEKLDRDEHSLLLLPLVPGAPPIAARRAHIDRRPGGNYSWFGSIAGGGSVVFAVQNHRVRGTITYGTTTFQLTTTIDGHFQIARIDIAALPPVHPPGTHLAAGPRPADATQDGPIEVIVAYTNNAATACPDLEATIQVAVDLATTISERSGIDTTFHLAHVYKTNSDQWPNMNTDLQWFATADDTHFDEIQGLRDEYHADLAVLVIDTDGAYQGMSTQVMATADTAFSVVDCQFIADNFSMAHEIGHLMGLRHDPADDPTSEPFADGHGYVHVADDPAPRWRTVMANSESCASPCPRIPNWSNPNVHYPPDSPDTTGTMDVSNSARVIAATAGAVSRFR